MFIAKGKNSLPRCSVYLLNLFKWYATAGAFKRSPIFINFT